MFGSRRHAAPAQPLTKETANANATTAATSAFLRRASDASLSSAAAAAALKARPTSPTNVADVQSKRLLRRSPSVSSTSGGRRELTRTPSIGSMMERTFRSPSPGRSPAPMLYNIPPVPNIPNVDSYKPSSRPTSSSRKASTLQTQNFRTASEKMKNGQAWSWFAAAAAHDLGRVRRATSELQLSSTRAPSEPRPGSVSPSINFSYPRARLRSPSGSLRSLQIEDQTLVYDPNSRRMVPRAQAEARSHAIYEEGHGESPREKPQAKTKAKQPKHAKQPHLSRVGSHLSRGTVARTKAQALESSDVEVQPISSPAPEPCPDHISEPEADAAPPKTKPRKKAKKKKQIQEGGLAMSVSMVAQDEGRSLHATPPTSQNDKALERVSPVGEGSSAPVSANGRATKPAVKASTAASPPNLKSKAKAVTGREPSESPARSARFAASADQLAVRHEPLPRSLSPRKSALKQASPTRALTPSEDRFDGAGLPTTLHVNDDARKKSFRVSWDDRNTVVVSEPAAQSPPEQVASSSPQTKKPWHGLIGKSAKKESPPVEKDETMSPRPALPSFGSVREKKPKEQEERPLVRPEHITQGENLATTILSSAASLVEQNTSKHRELLPTVLPSVETDEELSSSEYDLMEDTSDEDLDSDTGISRLGTNGTATKSKGITENMVPEISVSHASPKQPLENEGNALFRPLDAEDIDTSGSDDLEMGDVHGPITGQQMDDIKEEEEEPDMYSDAHEEITELDGNGFLSLDAVLESPTGSPMANTAKDLHTANEKGTGPAEQPNHQGGPPDDWEKAKAYWRSLSSEKRRQLEQEAMDEAEEDNEDMSKAATPSRLDQKDQNTTPKQGSIRHIAPSTITPNNIEDAVPETSAANPKLLNANGTHIRKSMREGQPSEAPQPESRKLGGSLQKSMRSERPVSAGAESLTQRLAEPASPISIPRMKRSLRQSSTDLTSSELRPSLSGNDRPASYHAPSGSALSIRHAQSPGTNGSASPVSMVHPAGMRTSLRRRGSGSSESSFTRARADSSGAHGFRKPMRGSMREPPATSEHFRESNRANLRPLSPPSMGLRRNSVSSLPPATSFGAGRMRHSLRGESADPSTRKRMSAFGKPTTGKAKKGKGGSRFGDSSDEDDGPLNMNIFKSRFADSSSEDDEPQTKMRAKGLPKSLRSKSNNGTTSSAADPSFTRTGHESPSLFTSNSTLTQPKRSGSGGALASITKAEHFGEANGGSFRTQHNRRGSFISLLRRKKDPTGKISRDVAESAARLDTNLERTPEQLEALRNATLHKRGPSWPLPESEENGSSATQHSPDRPSTAGGPSVSSKSKFLRRRSASQGMVPADTNDMDDFIVDPVPQKKKKFGALRKMFGLHD